jgi:N-glycosylase/DNA lyase
MKLIDEKGKLFGIINIIDLAVLVVVLLVVGVVGYKVLGNKIDSALGTDTAAKEIVFTVKCAGKSPSAIEELKKGDKLISVTNYVDAYVDSFTSYPADITVTTDDGRVVISKDPYKLDVVITVKMKYVPGDIIKLGTQDISAGKPFTFKTHTVEMGGMIDNIEEK